MIVAGEPLLARALARARRFVRRGMSAATAADTIWHPAPECSVPHRVHVSIFWLMADRPEHHYVPALKGKRGEFDALANLADAERPRVTPMIEIIPVPWDWTNDVPTRPLGEHLESTVNRLTSGWGGEQPVWLDTLWLEPGDAVAGKPALEHLFDVARGELEALPVGGPGRDATHTQSVAAIQVIDQRGVVLRLDPEDLGDPTALTAAVTGWLQAVGVSASEADLVVDFSAIDSAVAPGISLAASAIIPTLPYLRDWRTFTVASGGFPVNLSEIKTDSIHRLPRCDWTLWQTVAGRTPPRVPAFGDYGIGHPELTELDPRVIRPTATIRYTADDEWVVVKRRSTRHGFEQFRTASTTLLTQPEWEAKAHCDGCAFISACAAGGPTGNLTTWRRVGTLHHLTHTAAQLASLP